MKSFAKSILFSGILVVLAGSSVGLAGTDEDAAAIFAKIENIKKTMKPEGGLCALPSAGECALETYCAAVAPERNSGYLYRGDNGHAMPNFTLVYASEAYGACVQPSLVKELAEQSKDPFLFPHLMLNPAAKELRQQYDAQVERVRGIVEDSRNKIITLLEKKKTSKSRAEIDAMIARVKTVKLNTIEDFSPEGLDIAGCAKPNAFYTGSEAPIHTIKVCPQFMNLPDAALFTAIAHELSHSFDPCILSHTLVSSNESGFKIVPPDFGVPQGFVSTSQAIEAKKNPFSASLKCLQSKDSVAIKIPTLQERRRELHKKIETLKANLSSEELEEDGEYIATQRTLRDLDETYQSVGYCPNLEEREDPRHLLQESFADMISAEVLAMKISEMKSPEAAKKWAFESQLIALEKDCLGFSESQKNAMTAGMLSKKCDTQKVDALFGTFDKKTHLSWSERSSRIYMASQKVQSALSCRSKSVGPKPAAKSCF